MTNFQFKTLLVLAGGLVLIGFKEGCITFPSHSDPQSHPDTQPGPRRSAPANSAPTSPYKFL